MKPKKLKSAPVKLFLTNARTGQVYEVVWETGETFQDACRRAGLPALIYIEDPEVKL